MKQIILLLTFSVFNFGLIAQTIVQQDWIQQFDGAVSLNDGAFIVDIDGNIVVSGVTETNPGTFKILTVKYAPNGTQLWATVHSTPGLFPEADFSNDIQTDNLGNVYIAGSVAIGPGGTDKEFTTIKYDATGIQQWVATHADTGEAYALELDTLGNVYVVGWTRSPLTNKEEYTTVKYSPSGIQLWSVTYDGGDRDIASDLVLDDLGNIYVTGASQLVSSNRLNHHTVKYNNSGVQQWIAQYNNGSFANTGSEQRSVTAAGKIAIDNGVIYVTGAEDNGGDPDYLLINYDDLGVQQWNISFDGTGSGVDYISDLDVLTTGEIVITGRSFNGVSDDYVTILHDSSTGSQVWIQQFDGVAGGDDRGRGLALDNNDNVYVTGVSDNGTDNDFGTVKYSPNGLELWRIGFDGGVFGNDEANDIGVDADKNVYVVGLSFNGSNFDYTSVKYTQVEPLDVSGDAIDASCNGLSDGGVNIEVFGGDPPYTFLWSNGSTSEDIDSLTTGDYSVTVTDSLGSSVSDSFFVHEPNVDNPYTTDIFSDPLGCNDLFFSEYVEGSGKNRSVEIFNASDGCRDLSRYSLKIYKNGNSNNPVIVSLTGILRPLDVFVCAHDQADANIISKCDFVSSDINFDGNDALALYKNDTLIDIIGEIGNTPGNNGWQVGTGFTKDYTLKRKLDVTKPTQYWSLAQLEYDVLGVDKTDSLGFHNSSCRGTCLPWRKPFITYVDASSSFNESTPTVAITIHVSKKMPQPGSFFVCECDIGNAATCGATADFTMFTFSQPNQSIHPQNNGGCWIDIPGVCKGWQEQLPKGFSGDFTFNVDINDDNIIENNEVVCFDLKKWECTRVSSKEGNKKHLLTIVDNDPQSLGDNNDPDYLDVLVYPSITTGVISLLLEDSDVGNVNVDVISNMGEIVWVREFLSVKEGRFNLNMSELASGIYFIRVSKDSRTHYEKFVKL